MSIIPLIVVTLLGVGCGVSGGELNCSIGYDGGFSMWSISAACKSVMVAHVLSSTMNNISSQHDLIANFQNKSLVQKCLHGLVVDVSHSFGTATFTNTSILTAPAVFKASTFAEVLDCIATGGVGMKLVATPREATIGLGTALDGGLRGSPRGVCCPRIGGRGLARVSGKHPVSGVARGS